ncbi:MAG: RNA polymerase sigma factor [Planctomycetaceae bacterium]
MSEPAADPILVRRFLDGDRTAFEALVRRHEGRVYAVCLRILGDADEAADAAQDTFLTVLRKLDQFRGDAAFTTWLHRVAVNACYDALRAKRRRPMLHLASDESLPEPGPPHPDHGDEVAATRDAAAALAMVPEEFRVALVLADIEDLPYAEIARVLDVPVGTVKSRVHRGRIALARAMGMQVPVTGEPARPSRSSEEQA